MLYECVCVCVCFRVNFFFIIMRGRGVVALQLRVCVLSQLARVSVDVVISGHI